MGKISEAFERAREKLKDPNYQPPEPETFELPPIPEPGEYHVMFLRRRRGPAEAGSENKSPGSNGVS